MCVPESAPFDADSTLMKPDAGCSASVICLEWVGMVVSDVLRGGLYSELVSVTLTKSSSPAVKMRLFFCHHFSYERRSVVGSGTVHSMLYNRVLCSSTGQRTSSVEFSLTDLS